MNLNKFPELYNGSGLEFISKYIIPTLPEVEKVVSITSSLLDYLKDDLNLRYVRKSKSYNLRSSVYSYKKKKFTVTDNEPALWIFMESYNNKTSSFTEYENQKSFPVAFALKKEERESNHLNNNLNIGKKTRENNFSKKGLKHCHILDCSPRGKSLDQLSLDQRMLRLLSPMNHFPFPSPKKFEMREDFGENILFRKILIRTLLNEYYETNIQKGSFKRFLSICGSKIDFDLVEDFHIEYKIKEIENRRNSDDLIPVSIPNHPILNKPDVLKDDVLEITKTRFYVNEEIFKKLIIEKYQFFKLDVLPKKGKHPKGFYRIPLNIIADFIREKKSNSHNWKKNENFHQDGIPSALRSYFKYS